MEANYEVTIVGAGPIGLACGIEASRRGIKTVLIEKGCLSNSIYHYPPQLQFFSSAPLLEIGDVPFVSAGVRPTRHEALQYYRRVAEHYDLRIQTYERVDDIASEGSISSESSGLLVVRTSKGHVYETNFVVLATGCYDQPNQLGIPGEDLPNVFHYQKDPHAFYGQKVVVVGGRNSAVDAALELQRNGAHVTLVHRGANLGDTVKYWLRPDIENRIAEGSIQAFFSSTLSEITSSTVTIRQGRIADEASATEAEDGEAVHGQSADGQSADGQSARIIENDFVFLLVGYHADFEFFRKIGIVMDPETLTPVHDPSTMETNNPGMYVAGVAAGGMENGRLFIENTRYHAKLIFQDIDRKLENGPDSES